MLYEPNEIRTSEKQLGKIFKQLEEPTCLLGRWATYHIVNKPARLHNKTNRRVIGIIDDLRLARESLHSVR